MNARLNYVRKLNRLFWQRVSGSTTIGLDSLGISRILVGLFILAIRSPSFRWLSDVPSALFSPSLLIPSRLFGGFPPSWLVFGLDVGLTVSILFVTLGVYTKLSGISWSILYIVGNSFAFSFGKIDHGILLPLTVLCMSFSGWGKHYALLPERTVSERAIKRSLSLLSVLIAFGMFTAGFEKAVFWIDLDPNTGGFMRWYYSGFFGHMRQRLLAPLLQHTSFQLFEIADYSAVLFELSPFIFLLKSHRAWTFWLLIACLFHLANVLFLNINFIVHVPVYLVFVDWKRLGIKLINAKVIHLVAIIIAMGRMVEIALNRTPQMLLAGDLANISHTALTDTVSIILWVSSACILCAYLWCLVVGSTDKPERMYQVG